MEKLVLRAAALGTVLELVACSSGTTGVAPYASRGAALGGFAGTGAGKIQHVVFIVQENRSFDNLFQAYPGADTVSQGKNSFGIEVKLQPVSLARKYMIDHSAHAMFDACDGTGQLPGTKCKMDAFDKEPSFGGPQAPQYVYVPHDESKPYFDMAHEWVLADRTFQSELDQSFVAHQYVIAAQAHSSVDLPVTLWGCGGGPTDTVAILTRERAFGGYQKPCFDYRTLGDELDDAGLSWKFYTSKYGSKSSGQGAYWSGYQAVSHIYNGPDWHKDVVTPQKRFITDVGAGKLANFTWITPVCDDSDHVNCGGGLGPSWVAALVNAVGESKFWSTSAIFVIWDDWGGLYDHVPPPYKGFDGVGFRVPLLVISAYAKKDHVSHVQYETTSVLRFAEDLWGLKQLAAADERATSPAGDCFDFTQQPRTFVPIKAPVGTEFFLRQPNDYRAPDYE